MTVCCLLGGSIKAPLNRSSSFDKQSQVMGLLSPSFRLPLANRCYIKTTGLRSTVAWAMASLAQIQVLTHIRRYCVPAAALLIFEETTLLYVCSCLCMQIIRFY